MKVITRGLFWFRHDLRLTDMPALLEISQQVDELMLVYVFDERSTGQNQYGVTGMGPHRRRFIEACLSELNDDLALLGQQLVIKTGTAFSELSSLLQTGDITLVASHFHGGFYEMQDWQRLESTFPAVEFTQRDATSLFDRAKLPFTVSDMPGQFTPFRKKIEKPITPAASINTLSSSPPPIHLQTEQETLKAPISDYGLFRGGEKAGQQRLKDYFFTAHHVANYKETRNALDDASASTRFSPWLASGSLSPRWIYQQLKQYEAAYGANDSTYWVYFELLWREFFFWIQQRHGADWFDQAGCRGEVRPFSHDEEKIRLWQNGETGYDIVDACMKQLKTTGFMSNRGRQLVASCFVHELGQNWQHGAAWFEHMLVDYDVGSNWGNWLYLAGVGHDPRGHRQFDLQKQTERYDPERTFINTWR